MVTMVTMMIKCHIVRKSDTTYKWTLLVFLIFILNVYSFNLKCPSQADWKFRAIVKCNNTFEYFCLYNNLYGKYVEGCDGPDWDRKGSKRIFAGDFTRGKCIQKRYQPIKFWTNESMSDCIFAKSICSEEGQIVYKEDSTKDDRTCRCDHKKNYSFIKTPRNLCYCIPTEEDCSCYNKSCRVNFTLSADYDCIPRSYQETPKCINITRYSETVDEKKWVLMENDHLLFSETSSKSKWSDTTYDNVLFCTVVISIIVAGGFIFATLYPKRICEEQQSLCGYFRRNHTAELTRDEVNFLRMIHLLFRVACPVVRMVFNHEIQPNQLQKTLDENKGEMTKRHRKTKHFINNFQWDLLYKGTKTVTSEDFDIKLMIYLLRTLAKIEIGDNDPIEVDNRKGAMLSRIMFIRNETTLSFEGRLPQDKFNQYWNNIGEAILNLVPSYKHEIVKEKKRKKELTGRLLELNPINIDIKQLRLFIVMSVIFPALILQKIISEYCNLKEITIEAVLTQTKHELYHKRIKTATCCVCTTQLSQNNKVIQEKQWEALFEISDQHSCTSKLKKCSERFVPKKKIDTSDLAVSMPLILYVPNILNYIISRLCVGGFDTFLIQHQHSIYHSMETRRCCKCNNVPIEKSLINKTEWNKLYLKEDTVNCHEGTMDCCCQYTVRKEIKYSNLDEMLLSRLFSVSGPISVLNKIGHNPFFYFLNWTIDNKSLQTSLTELFNIIEDNKFCPDVLQCISSGNISLVNKTLTEKVETRLWISRHMRNQTTRKKPLCHIIVHDQDDLHVKSVHITPDFPIPHRSQKFTNLTMEENNFLLVVHGLTKIAYPVIKQEFSLCSEDDIDKVRGEFNTHQKKPYSNEENKSRKKRVYLTQDQRIQLNSEKEQISDLKLMIYILKQINDEKEYGDQLDAIDDIRREIVQSSSGILKKKKFKDIMKRLKKAVLHLGGEKFKEKLSSLLRIKNIFE